MSKQDCKLILALDVESKEEALNILKKVQGSLEWVKIGLQMYIAYGRAFVEEVASMGFKIFLDLKLYDIPNTVSSAIKSLKGLPIEMLTIHASGGATMMEYATNASKEINEDLNILAVTVLTSFDEESVKQTGICSDIKTQVLRLAKLAVSSGVSSLVCSPLEIEFLRQELPEHIKLITPGIRPSGASADEQKRIMTPTMARDAGANYIVVGRPILRAQEPAEVAQMIIKEIS